MRVAQTHQWKWGYPPYRRPGLTLRCVCSAGNKEADLLRAISDECIRLTGELFVSLRSSWEGFDMDTMATTAASHCIPVGSVGACDSRPLCFRYNTHGSYGVGVFIQDVRVIRHTSRKCFGVCFPPAATFGVVLQHVEERQAHAVVVVPDQEMLWFTKLGQRCGLG